MKPKSSPLTFRIVPALHQRLEESAERVKLKKYTLALMAIEAAVEAIEANGSLVIPIKFEVVHVSMRAGTKYPPRRPEEQRYIVEEEKKGSSSAYEDTRRKARELLKKGFLKREGGSASDETPKTKQ